MKLSFSTLGCPDWSLEQIARNASAMGYQGVELRTKDDNNHFSPDASPAQARDTAKLFRDQGVPIFSVMGYCRFAFSDAAEVAKNQELGRKLINVADAMGARYVRAFCGGVPAGSSVEAMTKVVADAVRPLAVEASKRNITIAFEIHDDWCSGTNLMGIVNRIDSPGVGVVYDICNGIHANMEPWETTYNAIRKHICYCHIKDGRIGAGGKFEYTALGAGEIPLPAVFKQLKADGFAGYLSFEWEKKWIPELDPPEVVFPLYPPKVKAMWGEA
jgi:sugar phosphate isomerase/epimerase